MHQNPKIKVLLKSIFLLVVFSLSVNALAVWTAPTSAPTGGNIEPPINSSAAGQQKDGPLIVNGFRSFAQGIFDANVSIGGTLTISGGSPGADKILRSNASGLASWVTPSSLPGLLSNPMDSIGDMIYGGAAGVPTKLDSGTSGYVLMANGAAAPSWAALTGAGSIFGSQAANTFFAAPNGAAGNPSFRAMVTADIPNLGVTTAKIANNAVTITQLPAGATGTTYLRGDGTWQTPAGGVTDGDKGDISVSGSGSIWSIDNLTINNPKIVDSAVDNPKIAANAITSDKISDSNVTTADIAANAVTIAKLPAGATGTTFLRGDGTWQTPAGGVTDGDKGDITVSGGGTAWGIDLLTISTGKIIDNAVTIAKLPAGATGTTFLRGDGTWQTPSALSGGTNRYIPLWTSASTQSLSTIYQEVTTDDIGIATTTPGSKLGVNGNVAIGPSYSTGINGTSGGLIVEGAVGVGTTSISGTGIKMQVTGTGGTNVNGIRLTHPTQVQDWDLLIGGSVNSFAGDFAIADAGNAVFVIQDTTGNVGVGDLTPSNKLEITDGVAGNSGLRFTNLTSASTAGAAGTKVLSVDVNGDVVLVTDATGGGGVTDGDKGDISVSGSGSIWSIDNLTINNPKIVDSAVDNPKIAANAITSDKISDSNVTTADIAANAVTIAKLPAGATGTTFLRGDGTWQTPSGSTIPINSLLAATNSNNINNGAHNQTWRWDTLGGGIGLNLQSSASGSSGQKLFQVDLSGASAVKTTAASFSNARTGASSTNVGIHADAISTSAVGTNIAAEFQASGAANNYAIIVGPGDGNVGIGTSTPSSLLHVNGVARLGTASNTTGSLAFNNSASAFTATIAPGVFTETYTLTLPTADATAASCLGTSAAGGTLGWQTCSGGTGITTLNSQTGATQSFANDTNVTISSASNIHTLGWAGVLSRARGGTGLSTAVDDTVLFSNGTNWSAIAIPNCTDALGHLNYTTATNSFSCGTDATGGGGGVTSVTAAADNTLTISPNTGAVIAALNLGKANSWTATQTFTNATSAASFTGPTTFSGQLNLSSNFSQTGTGTFSTGSGAITLNGATTLGAGDTLTLSGLTSGAVTLQATAATTPHTLTLPSAQGAANSVLTNNGSGGLSWTVPSGGGGGAISALTAATATNNINNVGFAQTWNWNSLSIDGLVLSSTSTLANSGAGDTQKLFRLALSGANANAGQTTYASHVTNSHTGSSSTNIAGYFSATSGTNNYALFANGTGTGLVNGLRINHATEGSSWDLAVGGSSNSFAGGFAIVDAGTARFIINSSGNVGIGTTSIGSLLSLGGGASIGSGYAGTTAPTNGMIIQGNLGVGTTAPGANFEVSQSSTGPGTVTNQAGLTSLTGSGTNFLSTFRIGDTITVSGESARTISGISSNTSLNVSTAFTSGHTGVTYTTLNSGTKFAVNGNSNIEMASNARIYLGANRFIHTYSPVGTLDENLFVGVNAGILGGTSGSFNVGVGNYALDSLTTGQTNVALGYSALGAVSSGGGNVGVGHFAIAGGTSGYGTGNMVTVANTTGSGITAVGNIAGVTVNGLTNATAIGNGAGVDASNKVRIGNTSVTVIQGQVNFTAGSDVRFKKEIKNSDLGLDFILKLRPVSYKLKVEGEKDGASYGFIAQEVEAALEGRNTRMIDTQAGPEKLKFMRYDDLIAPMTKAIQEQQAQIEILKVEIENLKAK